MATPFRNPAITQPNDPDFSSLLGYEDVKRIVGLQVIEIRNRLGQAYALPTLVDISDHFHKYIETEKKHWINVNPPYPLFHRLLVILTNHLFLDLRDVAKVFTGRVGNECCVRSNIKLSNRVDYLEQDEHCVIFANPPSTFADVVEMYMEFVDQELASFFKLCGKPSEFTTTMFFNTIARIVIGTKEILKVLKETRVEDTSA